ncbi:MAG: RNA-binding transcriptional accessory protein [Schleiferiaceae bacterium]|nr:RNA-binding transcriptional accessory protein [Schleiferiaceae bacterium]
MFLPYIQQRTTFSQKAINQTVQLADDGATIPFIARYRKDQVDGIDEIAIASILDYYEQYKQLEQRRETILNTLEKLAIDDAQLVEAIRKCDNLTDLEDLYLPYKPKRKTRATTARELGLEPLAKQLMAQRGSDAALLAQRYVSTEVPDVEAALSGARDIIAEWVQESITARKQLRRLFERKAMITSKKVKKATDDGGVFQQYYDFEELLHRCPSHRFLALMRGANLGILKVKIAPENEAALEILLRIFVKANNDTGDQVAAACKDAWSRLLLPALETEFRNEAKVKSDEKAIHVFSENLRQLLLAPPLGQKRILAIDPGFQSGCKCVCLSEHGDLLHNETIYPFRSREEFGRAAAKIRNLAQTYKIEAIAIGNGTAGRETADFIEKVSFANPVKAYVVNEDGASVYSASSVARQEFPNYDVTVRGAVSIGRRLMDPLAELVKIDPKAIGVGQYQHDVNQNQLKESLERTVSFCVNAVGVNLNTASVQLLTFVSGLGGTLAERIVAFRSENGNFTSRDQLKKVKGLGAKAFQQCAGFLRIPDANHPLDNSGVHPEHYSVVAAMAKATGVTSADLVGNDAAIEQLVLADFVTNEIGLLVLQDIVDELKRPGRDPRAAVKTFSFAQDIRQISDVKVGMLLPGIITNITNFGAFVDLGIKQKGLIHISQLADKFVSDPMEVVHLQQHVVAKVIEVDTDRNRIALSLKEK